MIQLATSTVRYCRPCQKEVVARARPRFASLGLVLTIALTLALIAFSSLIGPFIMFTVPLILLAGFAIGPLVSLVSTPDTCPECRRELPFATRLEATHRENERERQARTERTPRATAAAASGDMKAA
jgi:hypothetical protein